MNNFIATIALRRGIDLPSNVELQFLFGKPKKGEKSVFWSEYLS